METINNIISHSLNISKYFEKKKICFLDIETTGLNRSKSMIYLIGVLYFENDTWVLKQYFANTMEKEKDLLIRFISDISTFDKLITYNGDSFDLPFINHRLKHHQINYSIDKVKSFDLYQIIKKNRLYLDLENLKLKTIERSLGFNREDIYSGLDCIGFYYDYIDSGNQLMKDNILKHNYDDLIYMLDIIAILDIIDDKKSFYFETQKNTTKFTIGDIGTSGDMITVNGIIDNLLDNNIKHFGGNFSIITESFHKFVISIEYKQGYVSKEKRCMYIETSDFQNISGLKDSTEYNLPPNILTLMIEKKYSIDNIKNLVKAILINTLE